MPLVSVIIATYKRPAAVVRAVTCALAQTVTDLEVVVAVEKDDPETIAALDAMTENRVRYVVNSEKNGPGPARDTAVAASAGEWVAFLDDDDEWLPEKLEKQLALATDKRTIVTTLSHVVGQAGSLILPAIPYDGAEPIDEWLFGRRSWLKGGESFLQTSSLMVPRALFDTLRFGNVQHEEWELMIRAVKQQGYRLVTVREPLVIYDYIGRLYSWTGSLDWIEHMRDVVTRRAFSGFCLTRVPQSVPPGKRTPIFFRLLRTAFRHGAPTARQLFAFLFIWTIPHQLRQRMRLAGRKPSQLTRLQAV